MVRGKKKKSFSLDFSLRWGVFFLLVTNFIVIYFFERDRQPKIIYKIVNNVTTNTIDHVSDVVSSGQSDPLSVDLVTPESVRSNLVVAASVYYDFFIVNDNRIIKMFDRYYQEGSRCSYGRISIIYPDRLFLDDGSAILNTKWKGGVNVSSPAVDRRMSDTNI